MSRKSGFKYWFSLKRPCVESKLPHHIHPIGNRGVVEIRFVTLRVQCPDADLYGISFWHSRIVARIRLQKKTRVNRTTIVRTMASMSQAAIRLPKWTHRELIIGPRRPRVDKSSLPTYRRRSAIRSVASDSSHRPSQPGTAASVLVPPPRHKCPRRPTHPVPQRHVE